MPKKYTEAYLGTELSYYTQLLKFTQVLSPLSKQRVNFIPKFLLLEIVISGIAYVQMVLQSKDKADKPRWDTFELNRLPSVHVWTSQVLPLVLKNLTVET